MILVWPTKFKSEEDLISGCWNIQLLIFWGHLMLEVFFLSSFFILIWSPELKFQIWGRSGQWLLRYSIKWWWFDEDDRCWWSSSWAWAGDIHLPCCLEQPSPDLVGAMDLVDLLGCVCVCTAECCWQQDCCRLRPNSSHLEYLGICSDLATAEYQQWFTKFPTVVY